MVLIEKCLQRSRHLEVQLLGDQHGNLVHLFERDCSVQRNHQKILEETPAPGLSDAVRSKLYDRALAIGAALGYDSTGTVEFIEDIEGEETYFLEVNTRLQVEHTVTEMVTGLDLVEQQISSASGETLSLKQGDISPNGWAIEARINAEDPSLDYRPVTGCIDFYREPQMRHVRIDSGVTTDSEVSPYYDSMLAKAIVWAPDRRRAVQLLAQSLEVFLLGGVRTNIGFLRELVGNSLFADAALSTKLIGEAFPEGWKAPDNRLARVAAAVAHLSVRQHGAAQQTHVTPWKTLGPWRIVSRAGHPATSTVVLEDDENGRVSLFVRGSGDVCEVVGDDGSHNVRLDHCGGERLDIEIDGVRQSYDFHASGRHITLWSGGHAHRFGVVPLENWAFGGSSAEVTGGNVIAAPMPGVVSDVNVAVGDRVAAGDALVVMEAMKLFHKLQALREGTVAAVHCSPGEAVAGGAILIEIEISEDDPQ